MFRLAAFQASGNARVKLHSFRQDLPAKLKADFQQDLLDSRNERYRCVIPIFVIMKTNGCR